MWVREKALDPLTRFACSRAEATTAIYNRPNLHQLDQQVSVSRDSAPFQQVLEIKCETHVRAASSLCLAPCEQRLEAA